MEDIINQIMNDEFSMYELSKLARHTLAKIYSNLLANEGFNDDTKLVCELSDDADYVDLLFVDYNKFWGGNPGILTIDTYHM